jgi:NAD(P)H-hydrate epimerase
MVEKFDEDILKSLYKPKPDSEGEDNGQVTIVGGSSLFHGAPLLSLKVASRVVDMVFFATPEKSIGYVAEKIKGYLSSFIWIPWEEVIEYVKKSEAILIGPGFMRFKSESVPHGERNHFCDEACQRSMEYTKLLLDRFPDKKWVIDAGSLQVIDPKWIPEKAILTPNKKEYKLVFGKESPHEMAKKHNCIIVYKDRKTHIYSPDKCIELGGGNPGMTKGGTGDVLAGLTVALLAKNEPFIAATCASYTVKAAADMLYERVGTNYNADDLAEQVPKTLAKLTK